VLNGQEYPRSSKAKRQKILYLQYANPPCYPPLEHSSRILADSGWQVVFLGIGAWGAGADSLQFPQHVNIWVRRLAFCRAGWLQKLHYAAFCLWVCAWVLAWRPDWVYVSDHLACPAAFLLTWNSGLRLVYHEHDSPKYMSELQKRFQRLVLWTRSKVAARAEFCILPNRRRAEDFKAEIPAARRVLCVWNCPSREEIPALGSASNGDEFWVLYHGSLVTARLPHTVLHAMRELPPQIKLRVIGYETVGSSTFLRDFTATASKLGLLNRLDIIGALPLRSQILEYSQGCQVGLSLMPTCSRDRNEQAMAGASNKAFDYLVCGLAVLVSNLPDWRSMFVEPGYGLHCVPEVADSIATALHWFFEHRENTRMMGELGRSRIVSEWNYEIQFAPVFRLLQGAARANMSRPQCGRA
jgi:glycosyltransferase involved in cell wall biosynthesis